MIVVYTERVRYSNCTYHKRYVWSTFIFYLGKVLFDCDVILWYRLTSILPDVCSGIFCHLANIWKDLSGNFIVHNEIAVGGSWGIYDNLVFQITTNIFPLDQTAPHETRVARLFIFNLGSWSISCKRVEFK